MAWTVASVKQAVPVTASPLIVSYGSGVGLLYVLIASRDSAADPYTTVTDDVGNTWTRQTFAPTSGTVGRRIEMWTCVPTTAFSTITLAFTGAISAQATLLEVIGFTTPFLDQINSGVRAATLTPAPFTITPTVNDALVIGAVQANSNTDAQITNNSGWTRLATHGKGPSIVYQTGIPSGAAIGVTWTFALSAGSGHVIASFVPAAGPTEPTVTVWNGTIEVSAAIEGVWNGTTIVPATTDAVF